MSGPKSSRYTLTAEQLRRILEEQERIRKELEEKARQERECKEARAVLTSAEAKLSRHLEMIKAKEQLLPMEGNNTAELHSRYASLHSLVSQIQKVCIVKPDATHSTLVSSRKEAERLFSEMQALEGSVLSDTDTALMDQRIKEDAIIADNMNISFESVGVVQIEEDPIFQNVIHSLEQLTSLELSERLRAEVLKTIERAKEIESASAMQNYSSVTVDPLVKRCHEFLTFASENKEQFERLLDKYFALCGQLGISKEEFEFSEHGMKELRAAVKDLEDQANQDAAQAYIRQSIDEVMAEMGYDVIGHRHVKKKSGKEFRSKLLTYENGTVINVTESSNGQITMEVGAADTRDRLPDSNERVALRKPMESFCRDFSEIERRLSERGVVLGKRLSMAPPEEAYAQIINLGDYEMEEGYRVAAKKKGTQGTTEKRMSGE